MKRTIAALILCAALLAACAVCAAEPTGTRPLQLGTSVYAVEIPDSYVEGERSEADLQDDMVAYLYSPDSAMDFDVYQFGKEGCPEALADFAAEEAAAYEASEVVTDGEINGIAAAWYRATEAYDGAEYDTLTYVLEDGDEYVEIAFWLDGDTAEQEAQAIIDSLTFVSRDEAGAPVSGGWTIEAYAAGDLPEDARAAFDAATAELVGAAYTPVALMGSQLVAGMNYCILCQIEPVVPDAVPEWALVYVYADLEGNAELTNVVGLDIADLWNPAE